MRLEQIELPIGIMPSPEARELQQWLHNHVHWNPYGTAPFNMTDTERETLQAGIVTYKDKYKKLNEALQKQLDEHEASIEATRENMRAVNQKHSDFNSEMMKLVDAEIAGLKLKMSEDAINNPNYQSWESIMRERLMKAYLI